MECALVVIVVYDRKGMMSLSTGTNNFSEMWIPYRYGKHCKMMTTPKRCTMQKKSVD
jgi:hypothetical protein